MLRIITFAVALSLSLSTLLVADEVVMAFGEAIPPFSFPASDTGIEIEVISEALAFHNHVLKPHYLPLARVPVMFKQKNVDAAMTDLGFDMAALGAYYGNPAVVYDNVFVTLKERNLTINLPKDLYNLSVLSFNGGIRRYPNWLKPVNDAKRYAEQNNQMLQILTLDKNRFDAVLSDISIFKYNYLKAQSRPGVTLKPVEFHYFAPINETDYRPVFWNQQIRDDFNQGLQQLKSSGRYQAIYDKYLESPIDPLSTDSLTSHH